MKRNGMCPICYARTLLTPQIGNGTPTVYDNVPYDNGLALTPPMGWSSWNTFSHWINEDVTLEMAKVMKEKGLADAGYIYVNIDDCWEAKARNKNHELTTDSVTFPSGIKGLAEKVNALGLKLGIYSSNGTLTCQEYPASLGYEYIDSYTFAKWGVEYLKLDFCHHIIQSKYAPWLAGFTLNQEGKSERVFLPREAELKGAAHVFVTRSRLGGNRPHRFYDHISGMDAGKGSAKFTFTVDEAGEYVLTTYSHVVKRGAGMDKFLMIRVNDGAERHFISHSKDIRCQEYRNQFNVHLKKGENTLEFLNPIDCPSTSDMIMYQEFGKALKQATADYARDNNVPEKKIVFSLCEWGFGKPYLWGGSAGNLWRTTGDIRAKWYSVAGLYEKNVVLYPYANPGHWNDPDMLEVGVGDLTYDENVSHFALWCMMAAPLILGNDIRRMSDELLALVKNKELIAINQDTLGKQCKRVKTMLGVDLLVKPLASGKTAVCVFNKSDLESSYSIDEKLLLNEKYIVYKHSDSALDALSGKTVNTAEILNGKLAKHAVKVFII